MWYVCVCAKTGTKDRVLKVSETIKEPLIVLFG